MSIPTNYREILRGNTDYQQDLIPFGHEASLENLAEEITGSTRLALETLDNLRCVTQSNRRSLAKLETVSQRNYVKDLIYIPVFFATALATFFTVKLINN
jgi:hypothetical protein